jgi:UPF0755 protein
VSDDRDQRGRPEEYDPAYLDEEPTVFADDERDEPVDEPAPVRRRNGVMSCLVVLIVLAGIGAGGVWAFNEGAERLRSAFGAPEDYEGEGTGSLFFEVRQGETVTAIARNLARQDVVASAEAFTEAADQERGIQVGIYPVRKKMSADAALEVLSDPANLVQSVVTIPEGLRVEQTLELLDQKTEVKLPALKKAVRNGKAIGLPAYAKGNAEGYLFPATYAFRPDANATTMLKAMVDRWRQAADEAQLEERAKALGYTPAEVMVVASLVEAEANRDEDRGKVARVIYNRLETDVTGRLLQIDATVNYALGRDLGLALTSEQLQVDSPYNTRRYPGLPPGPIESPGDAAIAAAANPPEGDWVYYATVDLDTGETKFTDDYDEFLGFRDELREWCAGSDRC